ncbi:MAG: tetratricopeptide repeat protein [Planctomycetes bacterium]|nr:tetratricopeptide repeat protein [Planctomycetota bacterium]
MVKLKTKPVAKKAAVAKEIDVDVDFLFTKEELKLDEILGLRKPIYCSNQVYRRLEKSAFGGFSPTAQKRLSSAAKALTRKGIALWLLNKTDDAVKCLEEAYSGRERDYFLALCYNEKGDYQKALDLAQKLHRAESDCLEFLVIYADLKIKLGAVEEALELLQKVKKDFRNNPPYKTGGRLSPDIVYYTGLCLERFARYKEADKEYRNALHLDSGHKPTLFRLAYNADLNGDDEDALRLYEKLYADKPVHTSVLINLGLLYEDKGDYRQARLCYEDVLRLNPLEPRARLYLKDVRASETMCYDETVKRKAYQTRQLLNQLISDFRLSVRARKCMESMKIKTLGDLIQKTEDEIMKCEDVGYQTLAEVKELLARRGLTLAQAGTTSMSLDELVGAQVSGESAGSSNILQKSVFTIDWSARVRATLDKLKVYTVSDLIQKTEMQFLGIKNFGQTSLTEIKHRLKDMGLSLKED